MAFEGVFIDKTGEPLPKEVAQTLETCVTDLLQRHPDADPTIVVKAAVKVGERARSLAVIRNLYTYAQVVIVREIRRACRPLWHEANETESHDKEELDQIPGAIGGREIEQALEVADMLAPLNPLDRQIVWLAQSLDYDHASIAEALNITVAASQKRLERAMKILREELGPIDPGRRQQGR